MTPKPLPEEPIPEPKPKPKRPQPKALAEYREDVNDTSGLFHDDPELQADFEWMMRHDD